MTKCSKCGHENPSGKFCIKCGTLLRAIAPEIVAKIDILQKRMAQDSLNPNLYIQLGKLYEEAGMTNEALIEYQKAITIEDSNVEALLRIGEIQKNLHQPQKALEAFEKAARLKPDSIDVKKSLFAVLQQVGNLDFAIAAGEGLLKTDPLNLELRKKLMKLLKEKKLVEKVGNQIEEMLAVAPNDKEVLSEAADYYSARGDTTKALQFYSALSILNPQDTSLVLAIGRLHCISGEFKRCLEVISNKLSSFVSDEEYVARIYLAYSQMKLGNMQEATDTVLSMESPHNIELEQQEKELYAEILFESARAQKLQGNLESSVKYAREALNLFPEREDAKSLLDETTEIISKQQQRQRKKLTRVATMTATGVVIVLGLLYFGQGNMQILFEGGKNARVLVDGKPLDHVAFAKPDVIVTPNMLIGSHVVTLEQDGYEKWEDTVFVGFGKTTFLKTNSKYAFGLLSVSSNPNGAIVLLDKKFIGSTPLNLNSIPTGSHSLALRMRFHQDYEQPIIVSKGDNTFDCKLTRGSGTVKITDHWPYVETYKIGNQTSNRERDVAYFYNVPAGWVQVSFTRYKEWRFLDGFYLEVGETKHIPIGTYTQTRMFPDAPPSPASLTSASTSSSHESTHAEQSQRMALINDPDGYTNVRSLPNSNSEIIDKITEGQQFNVNSTQGNWWSVTTPSGKNGYMHKSRIKFINISPRDAQVSNNQSDITELVNRYLQFQANTDLDQIMSLYGEQVDYFDKGLVSNEAVRQDKETYFSEWPERSYTLTSRLRTNQASSNVRVSFEYDFHVKSSNGSRSGRASCELQLENSSGEIKIVGEKGKVTKRY